MMNNGLAQILDNENVYSPLHS